MCYNAKEVGMFYWFFMWCEFFSALFTHYKDLNAIVGGCAGECFHGICDAMRSTLTNTPEGSLHK